MTTKSFRQPTPRHAIFSLLLIVAYFQLGPVNAVAQVVETSKLLKLAEAKLEGIKVSISYSPKFPSVGQPVQFTGASAGSSISYKWDFGDGTSSTQQNPIHVYSASGFRKVALVASTSATSKKTTRMITVLPTSTSATFEFSPKTPRPGETVRFADTTAGDPTSWQWSFGDGGTSTAKNPAHAFNKEGIYTVSLIASTSSGSKQGSKTVTVASMSVLASSFTYTPALPKTGQAVQFMDTSAGMPTTWKWDFGDGTTSTYQNPNHSFATAGSYSVSLTVMNAFGQDIISHTISVASANALTASFHYSPDSPIMGQPIQFTDMSTGYPTSWHWDFNDGSASSEQNPSHTFINPGSYSVTLSVSNASDSSSTCMNILVASGENNQRIYWVSPTGTATWANARSELPLTGAACCSLSTANSNAAAGDKIYLRGGTYRTGISPSNSGSAGNVITFMAYSGEIPTITVGNTRAITIVGKSYIKVDGIRSYESQAFFFIGYGACYNEITNCVFDKSSGQYSVGLISFYNTAFAEGPASNHNWLHHNVFSRYGVIAGGDDLGTVRISGFKTDPSAYNTFEDNVFYYGGHDNLDVGGRYNVVKNNIFHNEEAYFVDTTKNSENTPVSGYFGNRNIILSNYGDGPGTAYHTLIEGNRIGYAGTPPDDDGSCGIENAGAHTISRYNDIYGNGGMGYYSKMQGVYNSTVRSGSWARVYNNNIYFNGFGDSSIDTQFKHGICIWSYTTYNDWPADIVIKNNIVYNNYNEWRTGTSGILPQISYENNYSRNPTFINTDMSNKTSDILPDLRLQPGSPVIDAGVHLTQANGSGNDSITLAVDDALLFQDGTWGSRLTHGVTHYPDWIAIGTVTNVVQIASINYATKTITLASPMTWTDDAKIWLYSNSAGWRVLYGTAPDIGAHESDYR